MVREKKKPYITEDETQELTLALIEFNKKNNPIKIFNRCFDYYVETYNQKPFYCEQWYNIVDIHRDYEYNKIEKYINKAMNNTKSTVIRDFSQIKLGRIQEVDYCIEMVKEKDPSKGKQKQLDCPLIVWRSIEKIATNYAQNYKFFGYVQKEDLIMNAIEKCLRYMGNFSGVSSNNAFSYFSTMVRNSFLESLKKDYDYSNLKQKINTDFYQSTNEEQSVMQEGQYII